MWNQLEECPVNEVVLGNLKYQISISNSVSNSVKCEVYFFLMSGGKTLQNALHLAKNNLIF